MPFPFKEVCVLLERLENVELHEKLLSSEKPERYKELVSRWFASHRRQINDLDIEGSCGLLSTLLPHWRTDRVYGLQADRLCRTLGRALGFSIARKKLLAAYNEPGAGDLAKCFERVHAEGGPPAIPALTVDDVDCMLQSLAGHSVFSDPTVPRLPPGSSETRDKVLSNVFNRASPVEGKWLIRLILKDFRPLQCDDSIFLKAFHFLLPDLLRFQCDFEAAMTLLKTTLHKYPDTPDRRSEALHRKSIADAQILRPVVGTKISRPHFHKGRSIDSCMRMMGPKPWVLERKYDGEYCEIHIDLRRSTNPLHCIKIFSKSGKDSTRDRRGVHDTLVQSLRLGKPDCRFKKQAILLAELVVFSDQEDHILPFEEIRKHVLRSGVSIGADQDSLPKAHEHLAIVFFDLLLLDNEIIMNKPIDERRIWLRETYKKIHGRAMGADWTKIDFEQPERAKELLLQHFSMANAKRSEGVVLKPCYVPYFSIEVNYASYNHSYIKLKKDYIAGAGDEEDFAVIGASYNAQQAATAGGKAFIKWTTFHLGCLLNKEEVSMYGAQPKFMHVGSIEQERCIPQAILETANVLGNLRAIVPGSANRAAEIEVDAPSAVKMLVLFDRPLVFEVLGSGYEKLSNCNYLMLRHPRVKKLHEDRDWMDCVTFQELQQKGKASRAAPSDSESQEMQRWMDKLERSCRKKIEKESLSRSSRSTVSPASRTIGKPETSVLDTPLLRADFQNARTSPAVTSSSVRRRSEVQHASSRKRSLTEVSTLSSPIKRVCLEKPKPSLQPKSNRVPSSPLSEITNIANGTAQPQRPSKPQQISSRPAVPASAIMNTVAPVTHLPERDSQHSQADRDRSRSRCARSSRCPFRNAVVFLTPCIEATPYIVDNLLGSHHATLTLALAHWDRNSFSHAALSKIVSESQSHQDMRKIVLVESRRTRATREVLSQIKGLNEGKFRERIEVYDWRVLELCEGHDRGEEKLKLHFLGATLFDDTRERTLFVGERDWVAAA